MKEKTGHACIKEINKQDPQILSTKTVHLQLWTCRLAGRFWSWVQEQGPQRNLTSSWVPEPAVCFLLWLFYMEKRLLQQGLESLPPLEREQVQLLLQPCLEHLSGGQEEGAPPSLPTSSLQRRGLCLLHVSPPCSSPPCLLLHKPVRPVTLCFYCNEARC